jgi:pyrimidine-nucleoside phosphorylase
MLTASLLTKKRDGGELTDEEIGFLINGFCDGTVADYQMSSLAMAICLRGMTTREITSLTHAMWRSGKSATRRSDTPRVDKHSTGGLGDKVSLILAPLLAASGVHVPMISGRGLGLTGGTLDKLEAIPGFRTGWDSNSAEMLLDQCGAYIISASSEIAPADRKLYALRDVTGTVESIPLITASILSKKLSASLDALVMDVKIGSAAFMKTQADAEKLAQTLIDVGTGAGLPTRAILSDMDQPLGRAMGNAIEVNESLDVLEGKDRGNRKVEAVRELTIELCAEALVAVGTASSLDEARSLLGKKLDDGTAREYFERLVHSQGGQQFERLPLATEHVITAPESGYLESVDCVALGETIVALGGGRRRVEDKIDPSVGLGIEVAIGDPVKRGDCVLKLYAPTRQASDYIDKLRFALRWSSAPVEPRPLIIRRISSPS